MCKGLIYKIFYCEKLDWLKKEKYWKFDRIDFYGFLLFIIPVLLVSIFGKIFLKLFAITFLLLAIFGIIRRIKVSPGDIESKLLGWTFCFQFIFFTLVSLNLFLG